MSGIVWKPRLGEYGNGVDGCLGKWRVCSVFYDGATSKTDPEKYKATCGLPGIKSILGHFETEEEAKRQAEIAVTHWLAKAELLK